MLLFLALSASPGCRPEGVPSTPAEVPLETPGGESRAPEDEPSLQIEDETPVDEAPGQDPQVEPHVVVDPRDPSNLVAACMSVSAGRWEVRIFRSSDGGESWTRWAEVPGRTLDRPVLLAGRDAVFVLASEAVDASAIVVARSAAEEGEFRVRGRYRPPSGLHILSGAVRTGESELVFSFTDRTSLQDRRAKPLFAVTFDDQAKRFGEPRRLGNTLFIGAPQLAFDDSPDSPHRGRLYSVWGDRTDEGVASLQVAVSQDGGGSWSEPVTVSAGGAATGCSTRCGRTAAPAPGASGLPASSSGQTPRKRVPPLAARGADL
jgi:hypothetical protein